MVAAIAIVLGVGAIIAYIWGFQTLSGNTFAGVVLWVTGALLVGVGLAVIRFFMKLAGRAARSVDRNDDDDGELPRRTLRSSLKAALRRNENLPDSPMRGGMRQRIVEGSLDDSTGMG